MSRPARLPAWRTTVRLLELLALAVILADFVRVVARLIGLDATLHWDESVYAVRARSWVDADVPLSGWSYIRPPLLPLLASVPVLAGGDEWQLRSIGLVAGCGVLLASWWLARSIGGPLAGVAAAAILYTGPTLQKESATLLTDVPAAALLLLVTALLWRELEVRRRPGAGLVVAAVIAGLAFLMRYGSILALAPLLGVALVVWWPKLVAAPRVTLAALAVGAIFVAGHLAWSVIQTGDPLGIVMRAQTVVSPDPAGDTPYEDYKRFVPFTLAGSLGYVAILAGAVSLSVWAAVAALANRWRPLRAMALLVLPGIANAYLLTAGVDHAEERFFMYSTALLVIAGCAGVGLAVRAAPRWAQAPLALALVAAVLVYRAPGVDHAFVRTVETAAYYRQFEIAADAVAAQASPECGIVGGGYPIMAWYSRCETEPLILPTDGSSPDEVLDADERWAVLFTPLDELDAEAPIVRAITALAASEPMRISRPDTGQELAVAWRLSR